MRFAEIEHQPFNARLRRAVVRTEFRLVNRHSHIRKTRQPLARKNRFTF